MISGKIILKSGTSVSLDKRFSDIAKQTQPRIQQQANVIISNSRQELFGNRRSNTLGIAQRLKKRSINNQLGRGPNTNRPIRTRVFQRLGYNNRRRGGGGGGGRNNSGANSYLFGGQSGLGVRLRGQGRIGGPRTFRPRTRGYLNNNTISRFTRGNRNRNNNNYNYNNNNSRGRRNNNNNFNRGRGRQNFNRGRGRGRNNNTTNKNLSKESLDTDLDKYMGQTKIDSDSIDMNAV